MRNGQDGRWRERDAESIDKLSIWNGERWGRYRRIIESQRRRITLLHWPAIGDCDILVYIQTS